MFSVSSSSYHCFVFSTSFNQWDLKYGRIYSRRNGFGIMPVPPYFPFPHDHDTAIFTELYQIVMTLTAADEADIRQITPLINILSLSQGNDGAKGNINCLWQKSKLNLILPNLPKDCRWIVIKRRHGYGTMATIKSKTFYNAQDITSVISLGPNMWAMDFNTNKSREFECMASRQIFDRLEWGFSYDFGRWDHWRHHQPNNKWSPSSGHKWGRCWPCWIAKFRRRNRNLGRPCQCVWWQKCVGGNSTAFCVCSWRCRCPIVLSSRCSPHSTWSQYSYDRYFSADRRHFYWWLC